VPGTTSSITPLRLRPVVFTATGPSTVSASPSHRSELAARASAVARASA
jgi:hypothetical protein